MLFSVISIVTVHLDIVLYSLEQLKLKIQELYHVVCELEEEKYDWELRLEKQEFEVCLPSLIINKRPGAETLCFSNVVL